MNQKQKQFLRRLPLYLISIFSFLFGETYTTDSIELFNTFMQPVTLESHTIKLFFSQTLTHRLYTEQFMPVSFMHLLDLLEYSSAVRQPHAYTCSILDLFHTYGLKKCWYVNPFALIELLDKLPKHIQHLCICETPNAKKQTIKELISQTLVEQYDHFKADPEAVIETLSDSIYQLFTSPTYTNTSDIQLLLTRFLEGALDKLIWNPQEQVDTWESCKVIGEQLAFLAENNLIPDKRTLNQLYWSLVCRYGYFIDTCYADISFEVYAALKKDIAISTTPLLLLDEQEYFMESKTEYLNKIILEAEIKKRAQELYR